MLISLTISDYALITNLEIKFREGMSVMTGETGAGKSIIIGALSLVQGQRADTRFVREGSSKAIVEAEFDLGGVGLQDFFVFHDLDYHTTCIVRREVGANGKSRAFINDTPVSLAVLRELSSRMLDIHSQHENLLLSTDDYQLKLTDEVAANGEILHDYQVKFDVWNDAKRDLKKLKAEIDRHNSEEDYLRFQLNQLDEAELQAGEQEQLIAEQEKLSHIEEIKTVLSQADYFISESDQNILGSLRTMISDLKKIAIYLQEAAGWAERLESMQIDVKDLSHDVAVQLNDTEYDPERLKYIEERLDTLYSLQSKFQSKTVEELIKKREEIRGSVGRIENFEEELTEAENKLIHATETLEKAAETLHQSRSKVCHEIESFVVSRLIELGMPDVKFVVAVEVLDEFTGNGKDRVQFLFSANKNRGVLPVAEIASGGEISRVMLALKSLTLKQANLPTIIFDEIDTGVSGEIAGRIGEIMRLMSLNTQVIVITHLPQIASKGQTHYRVYKESGSENTETFIKLLNEEERINELAAMLSGKIVTEAALQHAKDLIGEG